MQMTLLGIMLTFLVGVIDFLTGPYLSVFALYFIPVFVVAWFGTARAAILTCIISSAALGAMTVVMTPYDLHTSYLVWNIGSQAVCLFIFAALVSALREARERKPDMMKVDLLTQATNRVTFYELTDMEMRKLGRYKHPFTVAYLDINNLKRVNMQQGHNSGDTLLQVVAETIGAAVRNVDVVARFGGDEFAILLPETGAEAAKVALERVRARLIEAMKKYSWSVSFSFGAVTCMDALDSVEKVIRHAVNLMDESKRAGSNLIEHEVLEKETPPK